MSAVNVCVQLSFPLESRSAQRRDDTDSDQPTVHYCVLFIICLLYCQFYIQKKWYIAILV